MYVTIVGAGEVGRTIAATLAPDHDVTVVDSDESVVEALVYEHDVLAIHGDGKAIETLRRANVERAELVIASTDDDEVNAVVCATAKAISEAFTIARVRQQTLFETWREQPSVFGVDSMVCTDLLTARAVVRISSLSSAQDVDTFAEGLVRMAEIEIDRGSPIVGRSIHGIDRDDGVTFAAIFREEGMIVPSGETAFRAADRVVVIGPSSSVAAFAEEATTCPRRSDDEIVVVGASPIGFRIAREFERHGYQLRLIEPDPERARQVAEALPTATVLEGDPASLEFLEREHVDAADLLVAASRSDEQNLLISLVARRLGAAETIAVVENREYAELFETAGVDVTITPREETAEEILRFTRLLPTEKIVMVEHDRAEVIEVEIESESALAGRTIVDSVTDLPADVVIGAIARAGEFVPPRGSTVIEPGDHVVAFVGSDALETVTELL